MINLYTIRGSLDKDHDLTVYFEDGSAPLMPSVVDEAYEIRNKNMDIMSVMDIFGCLLNLITAMSLCTSVIGGLMAVSCFKDGKCNKNFVVFFIVWFIISFIFTILIVFGIDNKIYEFLAEKWCKEEYDVKNYNDMKEVIEDCAKNRKNQFVAVKKDFMSSLMWRRVYDHKIVINLDRGVFINNNLQDDVILIKGYMSFNSRHYIMEIQMNEYTKYCLEQ